jgi:hypothetical protein
VQAEPELLRPISASTRRSRERYKNCVSWDESKKIKYIKNKIILN